MKSPIFTIITCTRNSEKYLLACLQSVISQNYVNYEHVLVDGESSDGTTSLISDYLANNKRARIVSTPPLGIANAMNTGIRCAKGKYLIHLHSDDSFFDKDVLQDVSNYLQDHPDLDWMYGKIHVIEGNGSEVGYFPTRRILQISWKYLLKFFNFIPHQAVFIKKDIFEKYGYFREDLRAMMDQELWLRINYVTKWDYFDRVISNYRIHSGAQSSSRTNLASNQLEYESIQEGHLNAFERYSAHLINRFVTKVNKTLR